MDISVQVLGDEAVIMRMARIPPALGGQNLERMLVAGALLPLNTAKEIVHKKTGNLGRSLHIGGHVAESGGLGDSTGTDLGGNASSLSYASILAGTNVDYAAAVEEGSSAHVIEAKDAGALFWPGAAHPVGKVQHPGTSPYPYMRPAFNGCGPVVAAEMAQVARILLAAL